MKIMLDYLYIHKEIAYVMIHVISNNIVYVHDFLNSVFGGLADVIELIKQRAIYHGEHTVQ